MAQQGKFRSPDSRGGGSARSDNRLIRFEMEPENRGLTDAQLLADLRRVARLLKKSAITTDAYDHHGHVAAGTICKRLGGWNTALAAAGLKPVKRSGITTEELVHDLLRVARRLNVKTFTRDQYKIHGRFGGTTIARYLGTWYKALDAAGLECGRTSLKVTQQELFDNLEMLWLKLGRQPRGSDICKPQSRFNLKSYKNRFGGIRNALRAFVQYKKLTGQTTARRGKMVWAKNARAHKTPRNVNWGLRYLILRRDHFRCRACGRSPANDQTVVLHVDHIFPWSRGGETVESNLQTLCECCNGGKADLQ